MFYSILFYVILSNCILLAFTKETKKNRKEQENEKEKKRKKANFCIIAEAPDQIVPKIESRDTC